MLESADEHEPTPAVLVIPDAEVMLTPANMCVIPQGGQDNSGLLCSAGVAEPTAFPPIAGLADVVTGVTAALAGLSACGGSGPGRGPGGEPPVKSQAEQDAIDAAVKSKAGDKLKRGDSTEVETPHGVVLVKKDAAGHVSYTFKME